MTEKLVRDRIPAIALANDGQPLPCRTARPDEMPALLRAKLREEVAEYLDSGDPAELADILEVLCALAGLHGMTRADLERLRLSKACARGGFEQRIVWTPQSEQVTRWLAGAEQRRQEPVSVDTPDAVRARLEDHS